MLSDLLSDIVDLSLNRNVFRTAILVGDFVIGHFTAQTINLLYWKTCVCFEL